MATIARASAAGEPDSSRHRSIAQLGRCVQATQGKMARPEGFEPPTNGFGSHYSIRLSYGRVVEPPRRRPVPGRASQRHEAVRDRHSIQFRRTNLPPRAKPFREGQEYPIAMADTPLTSPQSPATPRWRHYWSLMRADRPIGTLLLLWPTWWALWLGPGGPPPPWALVLFSPRGGVAPGGGFGAGRGPPAAAVDAVRVYRRRVADPLGRLRHQRLRRPLARPACGAHQGGPAGHRRQQRPRRAGAVRRTDAGGVRP